ncbi:F-box protein At3g07870-like [Actinidia eriantha]|uniref:F-box protein At3g07870-like n=1 Tax=Actinidia eriantha TaxID=165200 RepID=UPI00258BC4FC|nr:F-box protein At3g07870-like [Actinidia eriantha]
MFLQCFKWIPHFCHQLVWLVAIREKGFVKPLPDDIIIDILSRLPAECVLECRKVCRMWLALTSTPHFIEMHLKRATPEIFVQCLYYPNLVKDELDLFIFYEGAKKGKMIKKMRAGSIMYFLKGQRPVLIGSCNGLLLFVSRSQKRTYGICNPVTRQRVHLIAPKSSSGFICGFFFHSPTKEFRLLYVVWESIGFVYFICTLGDKSWRRLATVFPYEPVRFARSVMVNGVLYWMVDFRCGYNGVIIPCSNSVMMFNVETEDFRSMPHPKMECGVHRHRHAKMQLGEMEGQLTFYRVDDKLMLGIWVLEKYENWFWVRKYEVNLNWDVRRYPFLGYELDPDIGIVYIRNDELLLDWCGRGLFRYHMGHNFIEKIDKAGMKMPNWETHRKCITIMVIKSLSIII